jgi:hypothetical protein
MAAISLVDGVSIPIAPDSKHAMANSLAYFLTAGLSSLPHTSIYGPIVKRAMQPKQMKQIVANMAILSHREIQYKSQHVTSISIPLFF